MSGELSATVRAIRAIREAHEGAPKLNKRAASALTLTGLANELATILAELDDVFTDSARDLCAVANAKIKVLGEMRALSIKVTELGIDTDDGERLARVETQLARKEGSASTSFEPGYVPAPDPNARTDG